MRVTRAKFFRKYLKFYKLVFGIESPFDILLDGNFIHTAIKSKVDIKERLSKMLQLVYGEEIKLYILKSVLNELELVGNKVIATLEFAKKYCTVVDDSHTSSIPDHSPAQRVKIFFDKLQKERLLNAKISKSKKYIVASQDKDLRQLLANVPGVPLVYLNKVTMVLEPPSNKSKDFNCQIEATKVELTTNETSIISTIKPKKNKNNVVTSIETNINNDIKVIHTERKKRKATGANPLSNMSASNDSNNSKRKKIGKYKRS
jgi:U3 small nucleolar RNA-associated protein 23